MLSIAMPPPAPLLCSVPGCDYETPQGAPTWEACITLLTTYAQSVHGGGAQPVTTTGSKLEKLPRPTFTLNMTESQWSFTKIQWDNYINQSSLCSYKQHVTMLYARESLILGLSVCPPKIKKLYKTSQNIRK